MSSKFLTYWSLTFAILAIWLFSILVALADVKDELLAKVQKQWAARARTGIRPADPLASLSVAETLRPRPDATESQEWVKRVVADVAQGLGLRVRILVLQDSMDHYLVHFAEGKRLVTYRVDKAWVADARAGKAEGESRIRRAVEQYLRQEFLGEKAPAQSQAPTPPSSGAPRGS